MNIEEIKAWHNEIQLWNEEAENGRTNLTAGEKEVLYDQNRSNNAGL